MTYVAESLIASSGGNCPECGTTVVVDQLPPELEMVKPLAAAEAYAEMLDVKVVDLPLSVRCRARIRKLSIDTLRDLLERSEDDIRNHLADSPECFPEIDELLEEYGLKWNTS